MPCNKRRAIGSCREADEVVVVAALGWLRRAFRYCMDVVESRSVVARGHRRSLLGAILLLYNYRATKSEIRLVASALIPVALASLKGDHFAKMPQIDNTIVIAREKGASHYPSFIVDVATTTIEDHCPNLDVCLELRQQTFNQGAWGDPCPIE